MVIDGNTGRILHASHPDLLCYPASLTKMMTLFIVFDDLKRGRLKFSSRIRASRKAANATPSKLGLKAGSTISLRNAIKALITKSANDVAIAIAETIAGSEAAFARRMNRRAKQLGMRKTHFTNASGLPDSDQVTTPRDILRLATALMDVHARFYHLFAMRSFTYKGHRYKNHNGLLRSFRGTDGLKTGYTRASGFNLVASVHRDGKHVIGAVFGGKTVTERNRKMRWLLTRAFKRASKIKTRKPIVITRPRLIARTQPAKRRLRRLARVQRPQLMARAKAARPRLRRAKLRSMPRTRLLQRKHQRKQLARQSAPRLRQGTGYPKIKVSRVRHVKFANPPAQTLSAAARPGTAARPPSTLDAQAAKLTTGSTQMARLAPAPFWTAQQRKYAASNVAGFGAPANMRNALLASASASGLTVQQQRPLHSGTSKARATAAQGRVPAASGAGHHAGHYHVQIGAYGTIGEAQKRIRTVQALAGNLLSGYSSVTMPFDKADKHYYRARFAGFDSRGASSACKELRRRRVECFVTRAN